MRPRRVARRLQRAYERGRRAGRRMRRASRRMRRVPPQPVGYRRRGCLWPRF